MTYIDDNAIKGTTPHLVRPNQPYTLKNMNALTKGCTVLDSAVRFSDGHVSGTKAGLVALREERDGARDELVSARPILSKVASGEVNQDELETYLASRRTDMVSRRELSKASREGHAMVLTELSRRLQSKMQFDSITSTSAMKVGLIEGIQTRARSVGGEIDGWLEQLVVVSSNW